MSQQRTGEKSLDQYESRLTDAVSIDEPWALLEEFADLERVSGTEDERRAAEYLTGRLDEFGVDYERYDPELYISQPHSASITVDDGVFEPGPVKTVAFSAARAVTGELVYVGEAEQSDVGADDGSQYHAVNVTRPYADVGDLSGKIALTAAGSLSIRATRVLEEKGAAGVIAIHENEREPHDGIATSVWGGAPPYDEKERIPDLPIANVTRPDGDELRSYADADEYHEVTLETDTTTDWMACPIVEARIEAGDADPDDDDFVLLHGHYDSWAVGIADNATGDAGLLELARVFDAHSDDLQRDLRVCWWPGHSTGRYAGSTWYADEFAMDLVEDCVAHVDMDSPGAKGSTEYVDMACWMPEMHGVVAGAIEDATGAPYSENRPRRAGDYSFNNLGLSGAFTLSSNIPADVRETMRWHTVGGCGGNADAWHLSTDTIDKAGKPELIRDIQMYAVLVSRLLRADVLPHDHARNVERHRSIVADYDDLAGEAFDFGPTLEALDSVADAVDAFYDAVEAGEIDHEVANETIKTLSRTLTRLNFVSDGQFEQDPAYNRPPYPRFENTSLFDVYDESDDEYRFLQVELQRAQNDAVFELRRLRDELPN
ncbi:M28 family metallopeptidase [Halolamina rubra]|uniref:M28 family metallopeptidase n=1 Tax=Halolamina rubra TaxID=1380430 RepID=UPI000679600A|nr:M28 family metallopeptidase [Halolamina rubra]